MKSNYPLSRKDDIVVQEADGEVLIYDLNDNKAFCLNETSALVWQMCDGNKSISEISEGVAKKMNQPANEDLIWLALEQLKNENLIANGEELPNNFEGLSRRQVIKKIGFGTMIALPIVTGLIAPIAVQAGSGTLASGSPCTASSQCSASNTTTVTPTSGPNQGIPQGPFTGSCCRAGAAGPNQFYGASGTCVPGPGPGGSFTVPQGVISYNGNTTNGGTVACL